MRLFFILLCILLSGILYGQEDNTKKHSNTDIPKEAITDIPKEALDFSGADSLDQKTGDKKFEISGYLNTSFYTFVQDKSDKPIRDRLRYGFLGELRLKLNWQVEKDIVIHSEFLYQGYIGLSNPLVRADGWGLLDRGQLSKNASFGTDYNQNILVDQAYFSADWSWFHLSAGKFVIAWGTGYFVNPSDKVNSKNYLSPSDQLLGTVAIAMHFDIAKDTGIRLYIAMEDRSHKNFPVIDDAQFRNIPLGIKFRTSVNGWDMSIGYAREVFYNSQSYERSHYATFDFSGEIEIGIYGEFSFRLPDSNFSPTHFDHVFVGLIGIDYLFDIGLRVRIEYLRNGAGAKSKASYNANDLLSGKAVFLAQDYLFLFMSKEWAYLYTTSLSVILNCNDLSFVIVPELKIAALDNLDFWIGAYLMFGSNGSEYDGRLGAIDLTEQTIYIKARVSF